MATLAALAPLVAASLLGSARGSGTASHEVREVPKFHAVRVAAGIRVALEIGPQRPLELSGDDNILPLVVAEVLDGELRIHFGLGENISTRQAVEVRVAAPQLDSVVAEGGSRVGGQVAKVESLSIDASGGATVELSGLDAAALSAAGSGGATLTLSGHTTRLALDLSGGSIVRAERLEAGEVRLHGSGGCTGEITAREQVSGELSGGSRLRIRGKAHTRVSTSGGSSVGYDG
ncbi:MAG TPA: DUF2807 domain-containing protein [Myxococcales bacterium]|jgi:hypothetical protein|nr:DUF2807 domain-containing protein [Myxococcales bacterium]